MVAHSTRNDSHSAVGVGFFSNKSAKGGKNIQVKDLIGNRNLLSIKSFGNANHTNLASTANNLNRP